MESKIQISNDDDDWQLEKNWIKSNPNLNVSVKPVFIKNRITQAINEGGSKEVDVKTKNLNIWTDAAKVWIPNLIWKANTRGLNPNDLIGQKCYGGLDLAKAIDLNNSLELWL